MHQVYSFLHRFNIYFVIFITKYFIKGVVNINRIVFFNLQFLLFINWFIGQLWLYFINVVFYSHALIAISSVIFCFLFWIFFKDDHVICKDSFMSPLPVYILFLFFSYLTALAGNSSMMLRRNDESRYPYLTSELFSKASSFYH